MSVISTGLETYAIFQSVSEQASKDVAVSLSLTTPPGAKGS